MRRDQAGRYSIGFLPDVSHTGGTWPVGLAQVPCFRSPEGKICDV